MRAGALLALALTAATPGAAGLAQGDANDAAIDARIRASAEAAESLQGPLDGAWTLVGADGAAIYAFQIVDKPTGEPPEGVWRDLRRPGVPGDIGFVDMMVRNGAALNISFAAAEGAPPVVIVLKTGADGVWSGQLTEGGKTTAVTLRRG